jgi:hypothetical protein
LKSGLALETIETIWALSGGIEGAAHLLEELVPIVIKDRIVPLFESWSNYLRSLSRESWQTMLGYLKPMRCVFEALGGGESPRQALNSIEAVQGWFGKRQNAADKASGLGEDEDAQTDRFAEIPAPSTLLAILENICEIFVEAQQFERVERILSVLQSTQYGSNEDAWSRVRITNALFMGLSGAGRFKEAIDLLWKMESPSKEGVKLLVRRLVSHGRTAEANDVFERIVARYGPETTLSLACFFMETYLAEERISDAVSLFERLQFALMPGTALDSCTDMAFMLGNFLLKNGNRRAAEDTALKLNACSHDLKSHIATRLLYDASKLRDSNRALFWQEIAKQLKADRPLA